MAIEARTLVSGAASVALALIAVGEPMKNPQRPAALHAALRFVITSEIPAEYKATLIEVLTRTLRDEEAAESHPAQGFPARTDGAHVCEVSGLDLITLDRGSDCEQCFGICGYGTRA